MDSVIRIKTTERVIVAWPLTAPTGSTVEVSIDAGAPLTPTYGGGVLSILIAGPDVTPDGAQVLLRGTHQVEAIVTTTGTPAEIIRPTLGAIEVM